MHESIFKNSSLNLFGIACECVVFGQGFHELYGLVISMRDFLKKSSTLPGNSVLDSIIA